MKKKLFIIFFSISSSIFSNTSNIFEAKVELLQPLTIKVQSDLEFGNIVKGTSSREIKQGNVIILGENNKQIKLTIRIKNERINRRSGDAIYLNHFKFRKQIFSRIYYANTLGSYIMWKGSSYSLVSFNNQGKININFTGIVSPYATAEPGRYSKTLEIVARYD